MKNYALKSLIIGFCSLFLAGCFLNPPSYTYRFSGIIYNNPTDRIPMDSLRLMVTGEHTVYHHGDFPGSEEYTRDLGYTDSQGRFKAKADCDGYGFTFKAQRTIVSDSDKCVYNLEKYFSAQVNHRLTNLELYLDTTIRSINRNYHRDYAILSKDTFGNGDTIRVDLIDKTNRVVAIGISCWEDTPYNFTKDYPPLGDRNEFSIVSSDGHSVEVVYTRRGERAFYDDKPIDRILLNIHTQKYMFWKEAALIRYSDKK